MRRPPAELLSTTVVLGANHGAGAVVVCGLEIGEHAFVAAGSVVTTTVPAHALVAGNPARRRGWVCACGERLDTGLRCLECGARHAIDGHGLRAVRTEE